MSPVINGSSFNTVDGTCVRDYVDVRDVADAHVMALSAPQLAWDFEIFNLGSGHGYTVLEIISKLEEIMGSNLKPIFEDARAGDPPFLVAECSKIRRVLGWKPRYNLDSMIESSVNSWLSFERTQL
jgi:UDP-glucose 4-epimerase